MLQRRHTEGAAGQNNIRRECNQFLRVAAIALGIVHAPAGVNPHVAVVAPAQLLQGLPERRDGGLTFWIVSGPIHEHADAPHALRLLRTRAERPRSRRAAEKRDELTPPHCLPRRFASMVSAEISLLKGACPLWVISGLMQCKK